MAHRETLGRPGAKRRAIDAALLGSVSLLALMVAGDPGAARSVTSTGTVAPTVAVQQAVTAAAQQAAGAAAQAQASLARAAAALAAARKLQQDAAAQALSSSSPVSDGLNTGDAGKLPGLVPYGGTASNLFAGITADPTKWVGGNLPTETVSGSSVTVNINQTQQKAVFYWDTFNVGANTTVNFKQSASDWIAFNRVIDPSLAPSRILGHINALGSVYVINRNGIIFGAGSQVDVHTLVASSLDIGQLGTDLTARDQYFLNTGIANLNSFSIYASDQEGGAATTIIPGNVTVERGASITANITTDIVPLGSSGSVYLFGANVTNSGTITAPTGEVGMVAARTIDLVPNGYSALPSAVLGTDSSTGKSVPFRGTEFRISQFASSYSSASGYPTSYTYLPGTGAVTHDGLIDASRGIVIMNGDKIAIGNPTDAGGHNLTDPVTSNLVQGVISIDTSVDRNGMVLLRAATSVTMNGVITSLPYDDGAPPLPTGTSFAPPYVEMTAQSSVTVGSAGLVSAPSAQVALSAVNIQETPAGTNTGPVPNLFNQGGNQNVSPNSQSPQTVLLAPGATIDVAGLQNVELPATYNFISFQPRAQFADMPLQRSGPLYGQTLWIDIRASGTRSDGTNWVGTPLADASGYVNAVGRSISQLMTAGGSVSLTTGLTNSNGGLASVQTAGSVINVAGGNVTFLPGMVPTTDLIGSDGRIYSMANADPNMTYVGIAGQFSVVHSAQWNVTETWSTQTQTDAPGYTQGSNAGAVTVTTVSPSLQGTMYFGSVAGGRQIGAGQLPSQGSLMLTTPSSVVIGGSPSTNFTSQSQVTTTLSADTLSGYGLSKLTITANDLVVSSGAALNLAAGGNFSATTGGAIDIAGTVSAAGGAINLVTDRATISGTFNGFFKAPTDRSGAVIAANVFVEGALDVSGRFVNDTGRFGTDASGPGFINGGSISITTNKSSNDTNRSDTTGSILLATGSVLDVSSGGYISPQGKPKRVSSGVMAGKAGSISLVLYQGADWVDPSIGGGRVLPTSGPVAVLQLDGSLLGYGFASNGSLTLGGADTIRIGGTLQSGETSAIRIGGVATTLPVSLLTGGGFGSYTIESVADGWSGAAANVTVSAGVNLTLRQQNLSSVVDYSTTATGTKLGQQSSPMLALLPDDQRAPVNLTVQADNFLLDTGAQIVTDPKATITFGGSPDPTLAVSNPLRNVPATSVELRGSIIDHGGNVFVNALRTHLGPQALIDLSGIFVANSRFGLPGGPATSGTLLAGGTFAVEGGTITQINGQSTYAYGAPQASYLVADAGALVDVSGSAGTIQVGGIRGVTSSVWSWSDAGTVSADVNGFAWGGSFVAMGGRSVGADGAAHADPRANNGTIILGGASISLRQDATDVNYVLTSFHLGTSPTSIFVAADQLAPFDTVYLYAGAAQGGAGRIFTDLPGSTYGYSAPGFDLLSITGSLNWTVANRLHIAAGDINAATPGNAQLSAPYVLLTGGGSAAASGSSTFTVQGQTIDVEGAAFTGYGQVNLVSSGDIRLSTPKVADGVVVKGTAVADNPTFTGELAAGGNVLLSAQRIYPVSAVTFTIETPGNVQFAAPAGSSTAIPLSAGGGITVIAQTIDQGGNLFAPLGKITLGNSDTTVSAITTQTVTLEPGSLTSVTLADTVVPYGATVDGTNWYYNANLNPLTAPPSKGLVLAGATVTRAQGSTIDLRGGGDLQAMEWIQGKGGSRDTLTTTPSGQTVYALVPSHSDPVSAIDIQFTTAHSLNNGATVTPGDTDPLVGTQITIAGGGGILAGTYTLYPAHYATLPGAMRVVTYGSNLGQNIASGTTLPDGTVLVTGHTTQSTAPGKQSSGQTIFAVQTSAVWQQYSEYSFTGANSYFAQQATKQGATPPPLPMDAGRLAVIAQQSILLNGNVLAQPGQDSSGNAGRGGELDISAPQLEVVSHTQYVNNDISAGYVGLDVTQLNGFESILIGGQRTDTTTTVGKGASTITLITPTATNVVVDTRGDAFTAPEILLVARQVGQWQEVKQFLTVGSGTNNSVLVDLPVYQPVAGTGSVTIKAGSIIETTGIVHAGFGRNYIVVSSGQAPVTAASLAAALGGTLSASGTEIDNADLANLPASWFVSGFQSPATVVSNSANQASLAYYANSGPQQPGRGALFVATNDPTLVVTGPTATGVSAPALTIKFADVTSPVVKGAPTGQVAGTLTLAGGDTTGSAQVTIEAGTTISTNTLTLQATATTNAIAINTTDLHASQVNLTAPTIGVGTSTSNQSLVLASNSGQFADVQALTLKTLSGPVTVYGDFNPGTRSLTFDAGGIALGTGGLTPDTSFMVTASDNITLKNTGTTPYAGVTAANGNTLNLLAKEIDLGSGPVNGNSIASSFSITGFSNVNWFASNSVVVKGPGALTLGLTSGDSVNLNITTPMILVAGATGANSQSFAITSWAGNVSVADIMPRTAAVARPADSSEIGGSLTITAANIDIGSTIQAQAGTITLSAIAGNLTLDAGAYLAAGGYKKTLVDVDTYVPGGKVVLYADTGVKNLIGGGNVVTDANSVIDVAQPVGGQGYGGEIDVNALRGNATLAGQLLGGGGPGLGGRFSLDIKGAADLTALADILGNGGINGSINIQTRTGNLDLARGATLTANSITLTADDPTWPNPVNPSAPSYGQVIIEGTINADGYAGKTADGTGQAGGQVGLFGNNAVVLTSTGKILARTKHSDERGGDVTIGIDWYAGGNIDLQAGSIIDVSGGTKGGLSGGTVTLRAPLDGNNNVQIANLDAKITGARSVTVDGFISIDTNGQGQGIDGSSLTTKNGTPVSWDGIIDPAGAVSSNGLPVNFGLWTNVTGEQLNVTAGAGYTAPPSISVVTSTGAKIPGTTVTDPQTGATFYQVTDPVTGTTFRSSLQVSSIAVTNGGSYTGAPTVTITAANGGPLPSWGASATATPVMGLNPISVSGVAIGSGAAGKQVRLFDAANNQLGTGTAVVTNGMLTGVTGIALTKGIQLSTVPVKLVIPFPSLFSPTTVTTGFSATMSVTGVTVTGGAGYSGAVNVGFSSGSATATATMGAAVTVTGVTNGYASAASLPKLTISGTGTGATASFAAQTAGLSGATNQNDVFTPSVASNFIPLATSKVFNGTGDAAVLTTAPYQPHVLLYTDVLANFVQGNGIQGTNVTGSYGFSGILSRLNAPDGLVAQLGASVVHFQPGIDLVNTSATVNSGNITVASNWNLAAGTAGNLQTATNPTINTSFQYFDPATSYVNFTYRLATPWGSLEAGALTLRAAGNIDVNASISDGFYQSGNYLDPNYVAWVNTYLSALGIGSGGNTTRVIDQTAGLYSFYLNNYSRSAVPIAPYQAAANGISPTSQNLATADLFPNQLHVCTVNCSASNIITVTAPASWSYAFTAGADVSSANPQAVIPLANAQAGNNGDVIVSNHTTYTQQLVQDYTAGSTSITVNLPTMVRTGTGSIDIAAARDVVMNDTVAPGVIYAAGVDTANLAGPGYSGTSSVVALNPDGFFEPQVLAYGNAGTNIAGGAGLYYGPPTAAAFPEQGGDVEITAQRDIKGYSGSGNKVVQYYQPWLLSDAGVTPVSAAGGGSGSVFGEGVFTPSGTRLASQTAWWIQYGSFQQGFLSAGGNVSVIAGRDLVDVSVSLPTTGRVSGGLSATSMPVTNIYGSGNMVVRAGQDILGGAFYEGSGHASIVAGGSIGQNGSVSRYATSALELADVPLLAVDTGQIEMVAGGSITMAGVVNPAALHAQQPSFANVLDQGSVAQFPLYIDTYGPDSKVRLVAETGDLTITIAPTAVFDNSINGQTVNALPSTYPASFEALALGGSLITTGISQITQTRGVSIPMPGIVLSQSDHGTFELLAQDNVDLTFGYPQTPQTLLNGLNGTPRPYISAGPSLIDTAFDPFQPDSGNTGAFAGAILAHADDPAPLDTTARIYAATGDITGTGSYGPRFKGDTFTGYLRAEINRPTKVFAGQDIVDLNLIVQNIRPGDVSTVEAGRNIYYTGYNNAGGLQVAGPGFFVVQAGGDIGPFLPAAHDIAAQASVQEGIASVGNTSTTPVGNIYVPNTGGSVGLYDESLLGPRSNPRRNELLTTPGKPPQGADIVVLFGAKYGADYQAVIKTYIDPANAANVAHNYIGELQTFLTGVGIATTGAQDAWDKFTNAGNLPIPPVSKDLKQVFVDQVFFAELKAVGVSRQAGTAQYQRGYEMINTMFPSGRGYTANALGGGTNGANQLVSTGDLNLLHGTIQTQQGGSVSILGPGGDIVVGSLATEPNTSLKLSDLGILTLGGGAIDTFTDQSVLVNSSRVLTTQGGDVLMWSSNGNLDAGRGSQTTLLTPALRALFDQNDYESVDLAGFVTGAGIGTLQASSVAEASSVYLLTPRGEVDFGTAGGRSSGNLVVAATVVVNAGNIQVQGTTTGIPVISVPNVGALTSGSNAAGAGVKSADTATASGGNRDRASVFIVEVIGYGGGDGQSQPPAGGGQQSGAEPSNKRVSDGDAP
jgi:filamentous hemagglutinin family protein